MFLARIFPIEFMNQILILKACLKTWRVTSEVRGQKVLIKLSSQAGNNESEAGV
jgi:hypothetical protein